MGKKYTIGGYDLAKEVYRGLLVSKAITSPSKGFHYSWSMDISNPDNVEITFELVEGEPNQTKEAYTAGGWKDPELSDE